MIEPLIVRTPIQVARNPVFVDLFCDLDSVKPDVLVDSFTPDGARVVYIPKKFRDWPSLRDSLNLMRESNERIRVVLEGKTPKEVLWAASYSEKNVIQMNLDMRSVDKNIGWVEQTMILADRCGMYCILVLTGVAPGLVKVFQLVEVIDRLKSHGYFHTIIKFNDFSEEYRETCIRLINEYADPRKLMVWPYGG